MVAREGTQQQSNATTEANLQLEKPFSSPVLPSCGALISERKCTNVWVGGWFFGEPGALRHDGRIAMVLTPNRQLCTRKPLATSLCS